VIVRLRNKLTISEIRHLIARLLPRPILTVAFIRDWSRWRREHQVTAAVAHRKIRLNAQL
jgi:predicted transposase YbfD/YdcC